MRISDWSSDVCSSDLLAMLAFLEENTLLCAPVSELGADEKCKFTEPGRAVPSEIHAIAKSITQHCKDAEAAIVLIRAVPDIADIRSEEHTSELQSLMRTSYAVFCLKKKKSTDEIN